MLLEENEPRLGPWWTILMIALGAIRIFFPAKAYSLYWWFQAYVIALMIITTVFILYRRWKFFRKLPKQNP